MNEILMPRSSLPTLYVQPGFKLVQRDHPDDPTTVFVSMVPDEDWTPLGEALPGKLPTIEVVALNPSHQEQANAIARDLPQHLDDVAELVRAARDARQYMGGEPDDDTLSWPGVIRALDAALKKFEDVK